MRHAPLPPLFGVALAVLLAVAPITPATASPAPAAIPAPLWVSTLDEFGEDDVVRDIAVDPATGTVFTAGTAQTFSTNNLLTAAYDVDGELLWSRVLPDAGTGASAVALDPARQRVYVVTSVENDNINNNDILATAYTYTGRPLWTVTHDEAGQPDEGVAVTVDPTSGTVHVVGNVTGPLPDYDGRVRIEALTPAGTTLWTTYLSGPRDRPDGFIAAQAAAIGPDGTVYVSGEQVGPRYFDAVTVAVGGDGRIRWTRPLGETNRLSEVTRAIGVSSDGASVYVAGVLDQYGQSARGPAGLVARLNAASGTIRWARTHPPSEGSDLSYLAVAPDGRVFVAGEQLVNGRDTGRVTAYSAAGGQLWTRTGTPSSYGAQVKVNGLDHDAAEDRVVVTTDIDVGEEGKHATRVDLLAATGGRLLAVTGYDSGPMAGNIPFTATLDPSRSRLLIGGRQQEGAFSDFDYLTVALDLS